MKILTQSQFGMVIEMNLDEFYEFKMLVQAVEGKTLDDTIMLEYHRDIPPSFYPSLDLSSVFGAIRAFYLQKFRVNDIQKGLDMLKESLEKWD